MSLKQMSFNDSEILREFGKIMGEKDGLKKTAQVAVQPLTDEEKGKLQHFLGELQKMPSNGPGMERWVARLNGQADPYLKSVHDALAQRYSLWAQGKDAGELALIPLPAQGIAQAPASSPAQAPSVPGMPKGAEVVEAYEKTADAKSYQVMPEENEVLKAHPGKAMVNGDEVENKQSQQDKDLEVAEKEATGKEAKAVLTALYKLAKKLQSDGEDEAYKLVVATFKDIKNGLKK